LFLSVKLVLLEELFDCFHSVKVARIHNEAEAEGEQAIVQAIKALTEELARVRRAIEKAK
jgi:hypothetical protein